MTHVDEWLARQVRRDRSVVRLEEALLGGRLGRYFAYRLRFFVGRAAISTIIHAAKVVLLLGAFPRDEFLALIILQAAVAMANDFWWGALEVLRNRVRGLQRRGSPHRVPREIGSWLSLSAFLSVVGIVVALGYFAYRLAVGFGPGDAFVAALLVGLALSITLRTFHSGAYALRRVYRPLPSLLALDIVSVGALLAAWPLVGLWAFPLAELVATLIVAAITLHYVSRTYRTLALPGIRELLALRRPFPKLHVLKSALGPGVAYALVGLEGLVVVAGTAGAGTQASIALVVLLAALAPVNRASFEWARLLYFDLKRLDVPLLAGLRARFDAATHVLAVVMAVICWTVAALAVIALALAGQASIGPLLVGALLLMYLARSLLAGAQMQAFTRPAMGRLVVVGAAGVLAILAAFWVVPQVEQRLLAVAAVLAISFVLLLELPGARSGDGGVLSLPDWLTRLRADLRPLTVMRIHFDARTSVRGTPVEMRRTEQWRRDAVAARLAKRLVRLDGSVAWRSPTELWLFGDLPAASAVALGGGLLDRPPDVRDFASGPLAAAALVEALPGAAAAATTLDARDFAAVSAEFGRRFPDGWLYDVRSGRPPAALRAVDPRLRSEIYRAALDFANDLRRGRSPDGFEVTALVLEGSLAAIFVARASRSADARRAWRHDLRVWTLRAAAGAAAARAATDGLTVAPAGEARML